MTAVAEGHDAWLRRYEQAPADAVTLVCLPHAGGAASYFVPLARALAPTFDVRCVQYPGRQDRRREPALTTIDALADQLFTALGPLRDRPLVLFGHSMGSVVGYELARRLEDDGCSTLLGLILSGRRAPVVGRPETVHLRDDDGLLAEIRELNGTDTGVLDDEELLRMVLPALRADYRAVETYRHQPGEPLRAPLSVLVGESDPRVSLDEARAWKELTSGGFAFRSFPGGHFYLNGQQAAVIRAITESIDAFRAQ